MRPSTGEAQRDAKTSRRPLLERRTQWQVLQRSMRKKQDQSGKGGLTNDPEGTAMRPKETSLVSTAKFPTTPPPAGQSSGRANSHKDGELVGSEIPGGGTTTIERFA